MNIRLSVILFLSAMVVTGGCATLGANDKGKISETLKPSGVHEDCMELSSGQGIEYSFTSSKPLNFNIHYHEDRGIFYAVQKDNTTHEDGRFQAEKKQYYCLMWTNPQSEHVDLAYTVTVEKR
jgi:hypothetical protein